MNTRSINLRTSLINESHQGDAASEQILLFCVLQPSASLHHCPGLQPKHVLICRTRWRFRFWSLVWSGPARRRDHQGCDQATVAAPGPNMPLLWSEIRITVACVYLRWCGTVFCSAPSRSFNATRPGCREPLSPPAYGAFTGCNTPISP